MNLSDLVADAEDSAPEEWGEFSLWVRLPDNQLVPVGSATYDPDDLGRIVLDLDGGPRPVYRSEGERSHERR